MVATESKGRGNERSSHLSKFANALKVGSVISSGVVGGIHLCSKL